MTDQRKDEMPELKAFRPLPEIRKDESVTLDYADVQRINSTFVNYVRMLQENYQTISPPVPNDVAAALRYVRLFCGVHVKNVEDRAALTEKFTIIHRAASTRQLTTSHENVSKQELTNADVPDDLSDGLPHLNRNE